MGPYALGAGGPAEDDVRETLQKLDPLWDELFPAEKERIVKLLVQEVVVCPDSLLIRLRLHGLNSLVAELRADGPAGGVAPGADGQTVDIRVPMEFKTRGGRKEIILPPDAATTADVGPRSPLVVALARAYRWQRMLDDGHVKSLDDLAAQVGVDRSYVGRIVKLADLAPDIVTAVLAGREPGGMAVRRLPKILPSLWNEQRQMLSCNDVTAPTI